jgi:alkanesulfonate monooxygenase
LVSTRGCCIERLTCPPEQPFSTRVFSTCPQSRDVERALYPGLVADVARWSEAAGCEGILVYTDNGILDPWLVSQLIIRATERLSPLVAVQPVYMHPYSVAKMVSTLAHLHGRRTYLNMVAGGFRKDLVAMGDDTPHDERYDRVVEYARIVMELVASPEPVSFDGRYYAVKNLRLTPPVPPECAPGITVSGSSAAGMAAARAVGAIAVKYPQRSEEEDRQVDNGTESGMRVGIITREDREEAWRVAFERFPEDRQGQIAHRLAMQVSDSQWHRQLSELAHDAASEDDPYWLGPFKNYKTFCPYLVGDHGRVAAELRRYMDLGFRTFILDIPASEEELSHIGAAFRAAQGPRL